MEFDDLKDAWKETKAKLDERGLDESEKILRIISNSQIRLKRSFLIDIIVAALLYLFFIIVVIFFGSKIQTYLYKLVILTMLFTLPIYYRMFRSLIFLKHLDYSKDIRANLYEFLMHYKTSIQFYRWGTYFLIVVLLILFFNDASFLALDLTYKVAITGYLVFVMIVVGPVVSIFYGRRVKEIESLLED